MSVLSREWDAKKQVCVLFCVSLLFLKLFFFCHDGNGPDRAEKNGPVQASITLLGTPALHRFKMQ